MRRMILAACGLAFAAALAGCGNATDNLDFKVPPGYQSKLNLFGTEMWMKGDSQNPEVLFLMKLPVKTNDADFEKKMQQGFDSSSLPPNVKNAKISEHQRVMICGDHPAFLLKATGSSSESGSKKEENMEMLFTAWNDTTYLTMYMYPQAASADPDAEAALKSVCVKKPS
jgi:hypothetical protein